MSFVEAVTAAPELEPHGLVVLRAGRKVLEHYWEPYLPSDRTLVYSCSKTLTATAVGLAEAAGLFSVTDRVVDLLPDAAPVPADPVVDQLTVAHLLSMSTGHTADTIDVALAWPPQEWARRLLAVRPQAPVGSLHTYNNGASFLLGEIIRVHTGQDVLEYLTPRVLAPMGVEATWDRDPLGRCLGWSGAHLTTADLAAFGELYRCDGVWDGSRLLPPGWVGRATSAHIPTTEAGSEWTHGYGYQLWRSREGFRLDGAFGQYSLVLPQRELVVGITSAETETQHSLDLVWDVLIPELDAVGDEPAETGHTAGSALPDSGEGSRWTAAVAAHDPSLTAPNDNPPAVPELTDIAVRREADGFRVEFITEASLVRLDAPSVWSRQVATIAGREVPIAARAGGGGRRRRDRRTDLHRHPAPVGAAAGQRRRPGRAGVVRPAAA